MILNLMLKNILFFNVKVAKRCGREILMLQYIYAEKHIIK
jgi:hypothetical protein